MKDNIGSFTLTVNEIEEGQFSSHIDIKNMCRGDIINILFKTIKKLLEENETCNQHTGKSASAENTQKTSL